MADLPPSAIPAAPLGLPDGERVERSHRALNAIAEIIDAIHSTLDRDSMLQRALAHAAEAWGCESAAVAVRQGQQWTVRHAVGLPADAIGAVVRDADARHDWLTVNAGRPVYVGDAREDERLGGDRMQQRGVRSMVVAPLIVAGDVSALLLLNHHSSARAPDDLDLHLAGRLAAVVALALKDARLQAALEAEIAQRRRAETRAASNLSALNQIHELSVRSLESEGLQPLLQHIMEVAVAVAAADRGTLQLIEADSLRIVASYGHEAPFLEFFASAEHRASACGQALTSGGRVLVPDVDASPLFAGTPSLQVLREAGVRSVQSTPMVSRTGILLGILTTQWSVPYTPDEHDLRRIDLLARQAADLIDVKRAETALRAASTRFQSILDHAPVAVYVKDDAGRFVLANRGLERYTGRSVEATIGTTDYDWAPAEDADRWRENDLRVLQSGRASEFEETGTDANGHHYVNLSVKFPLKDESGRALGVCGISTDITDIKRAEESLREANARLEELNRRKSEFIAILSHELRNPLAPIRYALPLLGGQDLDEPARRALDVMTRQTEHLARLLDDLLEVGRITNDEIQLRRERVSLRSVVTTAIDAATPALSAVPHTFDAEVDEHETWLDADPTRLVQILANLLDNSAKYTPAGGRISLRAGREDGWAVIRIADTGIGMTPEALPEAFEMFRQVNRRSWSAGGLGVGLAVARRLAEMHGGTVEGHSQGPGRGAEFVVRLPILPAPVPSSDGSAIGTPRARRLRVLVVDDNIDLVEMLAMVVECAGHEVRKALDGASGIAAATSYCPDVILLDLGLPGMSGIEVARELRRRPETANARLVALTGWGQVEDRRETESAGFDLHLTKPTDPAQLERLLAEYSGQLPA